MENHRNWFCSTYLRVADPSTTCCSCTSLTKASFLYPGRFGSVSLLVLIIHLRPVVSQKNQLYLSIFLEPGSTHNNPNYPNLSTQKVNQSWNRDWAPVKHQESTAFSLSSAHNALINLTSLMCRRVRAWTSDFWFKRAHALDIPAMGRSWNLPG